MSSCLEYVKYFQYKLEIASDAIKPVIFFLQFCVTWYTLNNQRYHLNDSVTEASVINIFLPISCAASQVFSSVNTYVISSTHTYLETSAITILNSSCIANSALFGKLFNYGDISISNAQPSVSEQLFLFFSLISGVVGCLFSFYVKFLMRRREQKLWQNIIAKIACYALETTGPWIYIRRFFNPGFYGQNTYASTPKDCDKYVFCEDFSDTLGGLNCVLFLLSICSALNPMTAIIAIPLLSLGSEIGLLVQTIKLGLPKLVGLTIGFNFSFLQNLLTLDWRRPEIYADPNFGISFMVMLAGLQLAFTVIKRISTGCMFAATASYRLFQTVRRNVELVEVRPNRMSVVI